MKEKVPPKKKRRLQTFQLQRRCKKSHDMSRENFILPLRESQKRTMALVIKPSTYTVFNTQGMFFFFFSPLVQSHITLEEFTFQVFSNSLLFWLTFFNVLLCVFPSH